MELLLGTEVNSVTVHCVDLINDTTKVTARFREPAAREKSAPALGQTENEVALNAL